MSPSLLRRVFFWGEGEIKYQKLKGRILPTPSSKPYTCLTVCQKHPRLHPYILLSFLILLKLHLMKLALLCLMLATSLVVGAQEICNNDIDDDADGLVDALDPDCENSVHPIIRNPSFEKKTACPDNYSQLQLANHWLQPTVPTSGSTDYYYKCGSCAYFLNAFTTPLLQPPDGLGLAGFSDGKDYLTGKLYKEYLSQCPGETLLKDSTYIFEFELGLVIPVNALPPYQSFASFTPAKISLFGHPSCSAIPFQNPSGASAGVCPTDAGPGWVELGQVSLTGTPGQWVKARFEFQAPVNINALVFGPSCPPVSCCQNDTRGYYFVDQLLLYKKDDYEIPTIVKSGDLCNGQLTLTATMNPWPATFTCQWYRNGVPLPGENNPALQITTSRYGPGYYMIRVTSGQKSFWSAEATAVFPGVDFTLEDTVWVCENEPVTLQPQLVKDEGTCSVQYLWQNGSHDTVLTVQTPGTYWFQTERNGCRKRDTVTVIARPTPVVDLGADTSLCPGSSLLLDAGNPMLTHLWQDGTVGQTLAVTTPGAYAVAVSNDECTARDTIVVSAASLPAINFSSDTILCEGEQKKITPQVLGNNFLWSTGSTDPEIIVSQPGVYTLQVSNACGTVSDAITIVKDEWAFFMPDAFTPNGDGLNDQFGLKWYGFVKTFELRIFDRWGQQVFFTNDPARKWDGQSRGKESPQGVYVWMIQYTDVNGSRHVRKGTVVVIR